MRDKHIVGMTVFVASEAVFFTVLILAFVFYRSAPANAGHPNDFNSLDVAVTAFYSVCLYVSSLTIWLVGRSHRRGRMMQMRLWLLLTIALGAAFIYGEGSEYAQLVTVKGLTPNTDLFGTTFYILTGFHGFHVVVGLTLLALLLLMITRFSHHFRDGAHAVVVETISIYWHFVDVVWVVIFPTVYLWSLAGPGH